jgi:hypothetical protein
MDCFFAGQSQFRLVRDVAKTLVQSAFMGIWRYMACAIYTYDLIRLAGFIMDYAGIGIDHAEYNIFLQFIQNRRLAYDPLLGMGKFRRLSQLFAMEFKWIITI